MEGVAAGRMTGCGTVPDSGTPPGERALVCRDVALVAGVAAILFLTSLGARDLWDPNEPIYSLAAVEMSRSGNWLVPTVNGIDFAEKPPLYFWLAVASGWIGGGLDELTLRLPLALGGILGVVLVYALALPYTGRARAGTAALLLATTYAYFWASRTVQMDLLVLLSTLGCVLAVTRVLDHGAAAVPGWILAGLAAALGFLAKGPIAVVIPSLCLIAYAVTTGRLRALIRPALLPGAAVFLAVTSPWFVLLLAAGREEVFHEVLWRQNFMRFTDAWDHVRPWWYYLANIWIDMAPWSLLLPVAVVLPGRSREERLVDRLAWGWILVVVAFLSLSESKRSEYALPVAPAVALLASGVVAHLRAGALGRGRRRAALCVFAGLALLLLAGSWVVLARVPEDRPALAGQEEILVAVAALGGAATLLAAAIARRRRLLAPVFLAAIAAFYLVGATAVLPALDPYKSARGLSERINELAPSGVPVASFRFWKWRSGFSYYTGRAIPNMITVEELQEYWNSERPVVVIVYDDLMRKARRVLGGLSPAAEAEVGDHTVYVFKSRGGGARWLKPVGVGEPVHRGATAGKGGVRRRGPRSARPRRGTSPAAIRRPGSGGGSSLRAQARA